MLPRHLEIVYLINRRLVDEVEADQRLCHLYVDTDGWARKAILNVDSSGRVSSDRTIAEYAADIWRVKPCPVS